MPAKRIDVNEHPALRGAGAGKHERLLFNSDNYHVWIHHSVPGDKGPMHPAYGRSGLLWSSGGMLHKFPGWDEAIHYSGRVGGNSQGPILPTGSAQPHRLCFLRQQGGNLFQFSFWSRRPRNQGRRYSAQGLAVGVITSAIEPEFAVKPTGS
jgi:hypothetical protein